MTQDVTKRSGRRAGLDVPSALAEAAERMFGEGGVDAVSLRAVARAAGVAPAAVSYHFPSKEALVSAVLERRGAAVGTAIREGLSGLIGLGEPVRMRAVVDAILQPLVRLVADDPQGGLNWLKVAAWCALSENAAFYEGLAVEPNVLSLVDEAASRAVDRHGGPIGRRRTGIAMFGLLNALARADMQGYGHAMGPDGFDPLFIDELAAFTAAGLAAPGR